MIKRTLILSVLLGGILLFAGLQSFQPKAPPDTRYIKINMQGEKLSSWSGPWSCVFDSKTGLLWEVKTDDESIHDGYWTYSWFDGSEGVSNQGDCYFEQTRCDTLDLIKRANQEKTCGIDTWRLPTSKELLSLVKRRTNPGAPKIAKDFFPQTKRGDYWTSDKQQKLSGAYQHLGKGALVINFIGGTVMKLPYRNAAFVRLVSDDSDFKQERTK